MLVGAEVAVVGVSHVRRDSGFLPAQERRGGGRRSDAAGEAGTTGRGPEMKRRRWLGVCRDSCLRRNDAAGGAGTTGAGGAGTTGGGGRNDAAGEAGTTGRGAEMKRRRWVQEGGGGLGFVGVPPSQERRGRAGTTGGMQERLAGGGLGAGGCAVAGALLGGVEDFFRAPLAGGFVVAGEGDEAAVVAVDAPELAVLRGGPCPRGRRGRRSGPDFTKVSSAPATVPAGRLDTTMSGGWTRSIHSPASTASLNRSGVTASSEVKGPAPRRSSSTMWPPQPRATPRSWPMERT